VTLASASPAPKDRFTNGLHLDNRENTPIGDTVFAAFGAFRMTTLLRPTTIVLAALFAAVVVGSAQASPAALQAPTDTCWKQVINDWALHNPNVLGTYPIQCYSQAIQHLNQYPDVKSYSSAPDDIHRALLAALRDERGGGGPGGGPGGGTSPGPGGSLGGNDNGGGGASSGGGFLSSFFGSHSATSVPLPLIVLGALAVLLALAALGTWLARRIQVRRMQPAPAPAVAKRR
jgi:hypothetical protein